MDSGNPSTSHSISSPLFPAYSTIQNEKEEKKDWLYNSSFTESTFKEACSQLSKLQDNQIPVEDESVPVKKKRKHSNKKELKKYPDPSSFSVPESDSVLSQLRKKTFIEETGLSFERAFLSDVTRDADNLLFDSFERTKIANYKTNIDIPFGLSLKESLYWSTCFPKKKKKEKESFRYFSKSFLKSIKNIVSEELSSSKEPLKSTNLEYIPLPKTPGIQISEQTVSNLSFIDVSTSWKSERRENEMPVCDTHLPSSLLEKEMREKVIFYNKQLSENSNDIDLWLKFVAFQDELVTTENKTKNSLLNSENSVIEKKIAILEKALKYNPKNVDLNIAKLKLSRNLHNKNELMSMWDNIVFFNPNNPQVWQEYLLFVISDITNFSIPTIIKLYKKCIRTLSNLNEGIIESHEPFPDIILNMLGIFNQLCYILNSCGYTEKAIAAYQALIEFNLFCDPSNENLSVNEKISCFEPFWDSGAQRIGEKNSAGWAETMRKKNVSFDLLSTDSDLNHMEDEILYKKLSVSETWLEFEQLRKNHHWLPWRPNPDYNQTYDDVDDVERTVSFDDISKFMFCVNDEEQKFLLILHFIEFLGFDIHLLGCHNVGSRTIGNPVKVEDYQIITDQLSSNRLLHPAMNPLCFSENSCTEDRFLFINDIFSKVCDKFSPNFKSLLTFVWLKFRVIYVFRLKNEKNKSDIIDLKKFAKGILKNNDNRNSLLLWFEYICIEWQIDKLSALKTFRTLCMSSIAAVSSSNMELKELWYFVQSFLDLYFSHSDSSDKIISPDEIVWIIIHTVIKENYISYSNQEIKPTMILKTVTGFKSYLEKELSSSTASHNLCFCIDPYYYTVINCAKCFAYFQYFYQDCDAALQVYENIISVINSKLTGHWQRYILEQIIIAKAELMNYNIWHSTSSIKPLQNFLHDSVKRFPNNSKLLYLLVKLRNASSVISPTRRFLAHILKNNKSAPVTWIFALIAEFAICYSLLLQTDLDNQTECLTSIISCLGINWRIRSLYENMLKTELCAHIPVLWRSYLKFEILTKNTEKGKGVFHRALQNCGWSKDILMDGIKYFPEELKEILALMAEKQIRVHTPLEEVALLMEHAVTDS